MLLFKYICLHYHLTTLSCPTYSHLPPSILPSLALSMGHVCRFSGCVLLHCTLYPHGYSVTTYLYFLIPSPLHLFPHTPLPSGSHQNTLCIHDSVSVLVCLVCFLDSVVDRYVFIDILLFIVLTLFFLNKSL